MEKWEYAAGEQRFDEWVERSAPGTYEDARTELARLLAADDPQSDYSMIAPCVVKRCARYPEWQPVKDHAAELLAELLEDLRRDFAPNGASSMQGRDLAAVFAKRAKLLNPNRNPEEFD